MNYQVVIKTMCRVARIYYASERAKEYKNTLIDVFRPAFRCVQHPKAGRNTQQKYQARANNNNLNIMTAEL